MTEVEPLHKLSPDDRRYAVIKKVTLIGAVVDGLLGVGKIVTGFIGNSQALIADGIHSLSDLATDFMVLFAAKHSNREADDAHPYGHARIETVITVVLGVALILIGLGIGWHAFDRLLDKNYLSPTPLALSVAFISIFAKEAIYHYTIHYAHKFKSKMLEANAWHSRSDAISSVIVVIGILGTMAGLEYLDAIAAIGVVYILVRIGWKLAWSSVQELVDTGLDKETVDKITKIISEVAGVEDLHYLRTRTMGHLALVDVHIQVGEMLSVSEGHQISETVRWRLIDEIEGISDVLVHIDPENDSNVADICASLPLRDVVVAELEKQWHTIPAYKNIKRITLHYLDNAIQVEVLLPIELCDNREIAKQLAESFQKCTSIEHITNVHVYFG